MQSNQIHFHLNVMLSSKIPPIRLVDWINKHAVLSNRLLKQTLDNLKPVFKNKKSRTLWPKVHSSKCILLCKLLNRMHCIHNLIDKNLNL